LILEQYPPSRITGRPTRSTINLKSVTGFTYGDEREIAHEDRQFFATEFVDISSVIALFASATGVLIIEYKDDWKEIAE